MSVAELRTRQLKLVPQTKQDVRGYLQLLKPHERAAISAAWLALFNDSGPADPWIQGFALEHCVSGKVVGRCGFKGPPDADGMVEIAYGIDPEHEGNGYATEAAGALVSYAFNCGQVRVVRPHTLLQRDASTRVLTKCGFRRIGEVIDPEDGLCGDGREPMKRPNQTRGPTAGSSRQLTMQTVGQGASVNSSVARLKAAEVAGGDGDYQSLEKWSSECRGFRHCWHFWLRGF